MRPRTCRATRLGCPAPRQSGSGIAGATTSSVEWSSSKAPPTDVSAHRGNTPGAHELTRSGGRWIENLDLRVHSREGDVDTRGMPPTDRGESTMRDRERPPARLLGNPLDGRDRLPKRVCTDRRVRLRITHLGAARQVADI